MTLKVNREAPDSGAKDASGLVDAEAREALTEEEGIPEAYRTENHREEGILFDEIYHSVWRFSLPYREFFYNFNSDCRFTPDVGPTRLLAMLIGGAIGFAVGFGILYAAQLGTIMAAIFAVIGFVIPGVFLGWWKGYIYLMSPPLWMIRRVAEFDSEGMPVMEEDGIDQKSVLIPLFHTNLKGVPKAQVDMMAAQQLERMFGAQMAALNKGVNGNKDVTPPEPPEYAPEIDRATTLYEQVQSRDIIEELKSAPSTQSKIQAISTLGIAATGLGILVFLMLITS